MRPFSDKNSAFKNVKIESEKNILNLIEIHALNLVNGKTNLTFTEL